MQNRFERMRNDTQIAPVLPECAHGINRIVKLREVLPPRAQWERYGCHSSGKTRSKLGRIETGSLVFFLLAERAP